MKTKIIWISCLCAMMLSVSAYAGTMVDLDAMVKHVKAKVKAADWKKMQTVKVTLDEFKYEPSDLRFKVDQPYKLVLKNIGKSKHYFTAPEFYRSIAARKVQSKDGEIKAPFFLALEIQKNGGELELFFIPQSKGTYPVYCTIGDHRKDGMSGAITVE